MKKKRSSTPEVVSLTTYRVLRIEAKFGISRGVKNSFDTAYLDDVGFDHVGNKDGDHTVFVGQALASDIQPFLLVLERKTGLKGGTFTLFGIVDNYKRVVDSGTFFLPPHLKASGETEIICVGGKYKAWTIICRPASEDERQLVSRTDIKQVVDEKDDHDEGGGRSFK